MDEVKRVVSRDGTPIAYARYGAGAVDRPAVVLVSGEPGTGADGVPLARLLARNHPVYVYDRRGSGGAGYALEREFEDLAAVLAAAGPGAAVHGTGTGGVLALAAAAAGVPMGALSVYEPPYDGRRPVPEVHARVLVVDGGASPAPVRRAARELSARLPRARHRTLTGQTHEVAPHVLAPVLMDFVADVAESAGVA